MENHYEYLEREFLPFYRRVCAMENIPVQSSVNEGIIVAHGDKCYSKKEMWAEKGIPFERGVAVYLLSHLSPWDASVRQTAHGWVNVDDWIIANYPRFQPCFI